MKSVNIVASFTDAWIETYKEIIEGRFDVSHLLQMRGLKLIRSLVKYILIVVASFTDAWIETNLTKTVNAYLLSHLLQMRGLKLLELVDVKSAPCRIFYRCVD